MAAVLRLLGQPPIVEGLFNYRGTLIPVVLMRHLFSAPPVPFGLYTPLILVQSAGQRMALCVDRVVAVEEVDITTRRPVPANFAANDCADGEFISGENRFVLLSTERLLYAEELQRLHELSAEGERRRAEIEASRS